MQFCKNIKLFSSGRPGNETWILYASFGESSVMCLEKSVVILKRTLQRYSWSFKTCFLWAFLGKFYWISQIGLSDSHKKCMSLGWNHDEWRTVIVFNNVIHCSNYCEVIYTYVKCMHSDIHIAWIVHGKYHYSMDVYGTCSTIEWYKKTWGSTYPLGRILGPAHWVI